MHSAIFALCAGTPVVTIPYDRGGKWGILDMMGAHDVDVPYSEITATLLRSKMDDVWAKRMSLQTSVQVNLRALVNSVDDNIGIPLTMYEQAESQGRE
jgi:polysaccharide pyruvyl transferase WcaK-like protein